MAGEVVQFLDEARRTNVGLLAGKSFCFWGQSYRWRRRGGVGYEETHSSSLGFAPHLRSDAVSESRYLSARKRARAELAD